ncbi:MAG: OmpH family outer membrane protein [Bacteroidales bacterium]
MRKLIGIVILFASMALAMPGQAQSNAKFGYVDSNELLALMPEKDSVEVRLREYQAYLEEQIQEMFNEYESKVNAYRANQSTMSNIIKQTREREIADLEERITQFQQTAEADFQNKQAELYNPLIEKARRAIKEVAEEHGYTYIFDVSVGSLLYWEKGENVLPLVKKEMGL